MSKKLRDLKWESVVLEGLPLSANDNFSGFVGLEECTEYGFDKDSKRPKKKKPQKKRKQTAESSPDQPNKKIRLSNGFIVENCNVSTPSLSNDEVTKKNELEEKKIRKKNNINDKTAAVDDYKSANAVLKQDATDKPKISNMKKKKVKLGEDISQTLCDTLTPEDMLTWAEFKLPEPILKALAELGYKRPTKIQQLSLPAAIHGRRDILGAAETGSGKTLAFGLPILTGILKIKEKAEAGFDVYEVPYKKSSQKKIKEDIAKNTASKRVNKKNNRNKKQEVNAKESSEDGYSSGEDSDVSNKNNNAVIKKQDQAKSANSIEEDCIEEYEVPVKKRETSVDEGNSSDESDDDGYIHLSELSNSDEMADSCDTETGDESIHTSKNDNEEENSKSEEEKSDSEEIKSKESNSEETDGDSDGHENAVQREDSSDQESEGEEMNEEEIDENLQGIGCVKVVDNVEIPGHDIIKTGKPLYALILTPTRELAVQISGHLKAVAKYTGIKIATIVGGMAAVKQERILRASPEIVVATPGRLWELMRQGHPHLQQVDTLRFLAIDETDRMIERNHFEELWPLLERLNADEARRAARQNFVFSATLTLVHDLPSHMTVKKVTKRGKILNRKIQKMTPQQKTNKLIAMFGMTEPKVVDITQENLGTAETLTESRITCSFDQKDSYLYYILKRHPGRTIVFCNSISSVKRLAQLLSILNCRPLPLHASMQQKHRLKNLEKFRDNPNGVLVATDVAARGLDIPDVDHVIHYQVPKTAENYVHRSGRTARATKEGLTILMMEPSEAYHYAKLCRTLNKTSEVPQFPIPSTLLSPIKDIVSVARDIDALESKKRKAAQSIGWKEKAARDMDMILDDDDVPTTQVDSSINRALKMKRKQLSLLLSRPLFPRGFSFKYPTLNDPNALVWKDENALQVMKKSLETGELKKQKRKSKNESLLKLEKTLKKK